MTAFVPLLLATALAGAGGDADEAPPTIQHKPVEKCFLSRELRIFADMADPSGVFQPTLYYRLSSESKFTSAEMRSEDGLSYMGAIPGSFITGNVEYYIEAYDNAGNGPALAGSNDKPLRVTAEEPPAQPVVEAPLNVAALGTAGGGVVLAAVGAVLYFVASGQVQAIDAKYPSAGMTRTPADAQSTLAAQGMGQAGSALAIVGGVAAAGGLVWFLLPSGPADDDGGGAGLTLGLGGRF